ncbi:MAG TPA: NifU N-terminal domain-containing protein [Patescibacteria group bacterium]|nr:NifU N-terminal domain-containing protein [Patescibacteria group bacterium]
MKRYAQLVAIFFTFFALGLSAFAEEVSPSPLKVQIDISGKHVRTFHLNKQVTSGIEVYSQEKDFKGKKSYRENQATAQKIFEIDGVACVSFSERYRITVSKGYSFSWDGIEEKVLKIIIDRFGPVTGKACISRFGGHSLSFGASQMLQTQSGGSFQSMQQNQIQRSKKGVTNTDKEDTKSRAVGIGGLGGGWRHSQ